MRGSSAATKFGVERLEAIVAPAGFCATLNSCAAAASPSNGCWAMTVAGSFGTCSYAWLVCQML
jgi:hypothetical protein